MFCVIDCKHLYMLISVNNLKILTTLYNIHQSLIRKSVSLFEIMNAHILLTVWSGILGYMHACKLYHYVYSIF